MSDFVLDASAMLAVILVEPGRDQVVASLREGRANVSTVNLAEVLARLFELGASEADARSMVAQLDPEIVSFTREQAERAAALRAATRRLGLSLGDRACLALGHTLGLRVLTADRSWLEAGAGVEVVVVRA